MRAGLYISYVILVLQLKVTLYTEVKQTLTIFMLLLWCCVE